MPSNGCSLSDPAPGRIGMVMPHFGSWPRWLPVFLESCRWNENVDWLFYTDCEPPEDPPANVRFHRMSLGELRDLISAKLQVDAALTYPFKVCDFRPAFGVIFADDLRGYDFWGWGDTDVVLGDIRSIITNSMRARYDVISSRSGFLSGEFTLIRNTPDCNSLFRESADHQRIFTSTSGFDFEECGFFKDRQIDSMTHVVKRMQRAGKLRVLLDDLGRNDRKLKGRPFRYYWHQGRLVDADSGEGLLLYHFLDRKRSEEFVFPQPPLQIEHGFEITPAGAVACRQPLQIRRRIIRIMQSRTVRIARRVRAACRG
jgi:hypothetical protein